MPPSCWGLASVRFAESIATTNEPALRRWSPRSAADRAPGGFPRRSKDKLWVSFAPSIRTSDRHWRRRSSPRLRGSLSAWRRFGSWMMEDGIWVSRSKRARRSYPPRVRRACLGELVQIDGCEHAWFEDRGPPCTLLVYVDDATSRLMELRFAESESTFDYFAATRRYLERHGKPVPFYSDRHSIFHVHARDKARTGPGLSQFGRALSDLNIDIVCANTPQAKGRVERSHQT